MSKKLFIQTINSMVDMETVFIAHPSYWSDVYDRIQRGLTDGIDQTFITIFKTIQAVQQIQNNSALIRADQEVKASRMLTSAIEYRIHGRHVTIVCENIPDIRRAEEKYFELVELVKQGYPDTAQTAEILNKGSINFIAINRNLHESISFDCFGNARMYGMDKKDILYVLPWVIDKHWLDRSVPHFKAYEAFSDDQKLSSMVHGVERALAMKQIADAKRLGEITQIATTPVNLDDSIFSEAKRVMGNNQ